MTEKPSDSSGVVLLQDPGILPDDPMSEAGRKTLHFHFLRMLRYEPGTRQGEDIEALHDMRVATRRMRAAFRVFGDYFEPKALTPHLKGLRRTGRVLGAVRDLDVFREQTQLYADGQPESGQAGLEGFLAKLESRRKDARAEMIRYLDGERYRRFVRRFGEFVETEGKGSRQVAPNGGEPRPYRVRHVAPSAIYERLAAVRSYDEWVCIPDPPLSRLHALRIACKRLRYTLEFFEEVLGSGTKALIKEIVAMQDLLGGLQDAVVASGILRQYLAWGTWGEHAADGQGSTQKPSAGDAQDTLSLASGVAAFLMAQQQELECRVHAFPQAWTRLNREEFRRMLAEAVSSL